MGLTVITYKSCRILKVLCWMISRCLPFPGTHHSQQAVTATYQPAGWGANHLLPCTEPLHRSLETLQVLLASM